MYHPIDNPIKPKLGRMWISHEPGDVGPPAVGDTVTVQVAEKVELYVSIEEIHQEMIRGKVLAIGPKPRVRFDPWQFGSKVEFPEPFVKCVFRRG